MSSSLRRAHWIVATFVIIPVIAVRGLTVEPVRGDSGLVQVRQERTLVGVSPVQAKDAWREYQWGKGGGLPVWVRQSDERRTLRPLGLEEQIIVPVGNDDDNRKDALSLHYRVTDMGPLLASELDADSHHAVVRFVPAPNAATMMTWDVSFHAHHRRDLWQALTSSTIALVSDNLQAYVAPPRLFTRTTRLKGSSPKAMADEWRNFVWNQGGGLPLPPPVQLSDSTRMIVPPFLKERILSRQDSNDSCTIDYTVDNPSILTAYPVHSHKGRVEFRTASDANEVEMTWQVEVRPYHLGWATWWVTSFTDAVVSTLARNFKVHVAEPGAMVPLQPPRGKGDTFAKIRKDTWLGAVMAAHLQDKRSVQEQTVAMLQPLTWGRSNATDGPGESGVWTGGFIGN